MENKSVKEFVFRVDGKDKIVVPSLMSEKTSEAHLKLLGHITDDNFETIISYLSHYLRGYHLGLLSKGLKTTDKVITFEELDSLVRLILMSTD